MSDAASAVAPSIVGQATPYAQALLAQVTVGVILPTFLLLMLLAFAWVVILRAQSQADFDIADLLREYHTDSQVWRVSTWRFVALMAFAVHSAFFYATLWQAPNPDFFLWYGIIWGGSPAAFELAQAAKQWNGQLPFARPGGQ